MKLTCNFQIDRHNLMTCVHLGASLIWVMTLFGLNLFTTEEESYEMIFQFTHSPKICYELFKKGKDAYKDKVMEEISFENDF